MIRRIIAYCLFVLGFFTLLFFRHYTGDLIPHPYLFWLFGILLFYLGYLLFRSSLTPKDNAARKKLSELINDLKVNGEKIRVDLLKCEIREHNYMEKTSPADADPFVHHTGIEWQIQALDALDHDFRNAEHTSIQQSVIIYLHSNQRTGKTERFMSRVIPKDKLSLSVWLDEQKQTVLYVDKTNRERYYFDLDFLSVR